MKLSAYILSLLMLSLLVQPLLAECQVKDIKATVKTSCGGNSCQKKKTKTSPTKKACNSDRNKECDRTNACNPFASCSQCTYTAVSKLSYNSLLVILENNPYLSASENLAPGFNGDCWQPPELIGA